MASIYQRNNWYWLSYYEAGKRHQVPLKTKDKKVARYKQNEIENKLALGDNPLPDRSITAAIAFNEFKNTREGRLTLKSQSTDHYRIERFIKDEGINRLKDITEPLLKNHLDRRIQGGISNMTANHTIRGIKTFLNFCVKRKYLLENPIKSMEKYPTETKEPRFLSSKEIRLLLEVSREFEAYPIIAIALYTGMRLGEIGRLDWNDINYQDNTITIQKSKSKKFRRIPLHPNLKAILGPQKSSGAIFMYKRYTQLDWVLKCIRKRMDIPHFRFHDLRHTFASMMIKSGADLLTVSKILGHSAIQTTMIYAHLYDDHVKTAVNKLNFDV